MSSFGSSSLKASTGAVSASVSDPIPWQSYYIDCTGHPPQSEFIRMLVAQCFLFFICISFYLSSLGFFIFPLFAWLSSWLALRVFWCALFFLMVILTITPIHRSDSTRNHWIYRSVCEYFQFRLISATKLPNSVPWALEVTNALPDPFKAEKRYISAYWPHGVVSMASFCWGTVFDLANLPGGYGSMAVASVITKLPLIRQIFGILGIIDSNYKTLLRALKKESSAIIPGGVAEMFLVDSHVEKIYLKQRKGFCKLALQSGASIIPLYAFNHTTIFSLFPCVPSSISRKLGSSLVFFWPLIPRRKQLILARGEYIEVTQHDNPTNEQVNELHERVMNAVKELFEKTKKLCGPEWENKELEIY